MNSLAVVCWMWCAAMCALWCAAVCGLEQQEGCDASPTFGIRVSVCSRRNKTGHLIAQATLQHRASGIMGQPDPGAWELDLDHTTTTCAGSDYVTIVATVSGPPRRAGPGYELVPGLGYYKLHTAGRTWHEARLVCIREGAHLAVINSNLEAASLMALLATQPKLFSDWRNEFAMIGISDFRNEGQWVTIFDEPLNSTGYTNWLSTEPSKAQGEDCGLMQRTGVLHDSSCFAIFAFFCEQEL